MYLSRDFEDVVTLIDGRPTISQEALSAEPEVREYLQNRFARQMREPYWTDGVEAHGDDGRAADVVERVAAFVNPSRPSSRTR
jgi:hypothetical protein